MTIVVVVLAVEVANLNNELKQTADEEDEAREDLRMYLTKGVREERMFSTFDVEPETCSLVESTRQLHVSTTQDTGLPSACSHEVTRLMRAAGNCALWLSLVKINPTARMCVTIAEKNATQTLGGDVNTCVWMRRGHLWLRRCVGSVCEEPRSCSRDPVPHSAVFPMCWHHYRSYAHADGQWGTGLRVDRYQTDGLCQQPIFEPIYLLRNKLERRLFLALPGREITLVFTGNGVFSVVPGDNMRDPYTHRRFSVGVEPAMRIPDHTTQTSFSAFVMDPPPSSLGHDRVVVFNGTAAYGMMARLAGGVQKGMRLLQSPFVCDASGFVRVLNATSPATMLSTGSVTFEQSRFLKWDIQQKRLREVDIARRNDPLLKCAFSLAPRTTTLTYP